MDYSLIKGTVVRDWSAAVTQAMDASIDAHSHPRRQELGELIGQTKGFPVCVSAKKGAVLDFCSCSEFVLSDSQSCVGYYQPD